MVVSLFFFFFCLFFVFFFKQKTAYEIKECDWSSDVCSSDLKDILEGEPYDTTLSPYFDDAEISWSPDGSFIAYTCKKMNST